MEPEVKRHLICEGITIFDLAKNKGISNFTLKFKKERNKIMGLESSVARLTKIRVKTPTEKDKSNYVELEFTVPATKKYPPGYVYKKVDRRTLKLVPNPTKKYQLYFRFMDFFDWLETYPEKKTITPKDIKDILNVADVKIFSNDPSFQYQGMNYNMTQLDAAIIPEYRPPKFWNKKHGEFNAFLGKHLQGIVNNMEFWYNPIASALTKYLKENGLLGIISGSSSGTSYWKKIKTVNKPDGGNKGGSSSKDQDKDEKKTTAQEEPEKTEIIATETLPAKEIQKDLQDIKPEGSEAPEVVSTEDTDVPKVAPPESKEINIIKKPTGNTPKGIKKKQSESLRALKTYWEKVKTRLSGREKSRIA